MFRSLFALAVVLPTLSLLTDVVHAEIVSGATNDFQDASVQGWQHGFPNSHAPRIEVNAGPAGAGDHAMTFDSTGTFSLGSRFAAFNQSAVWTGDYIAAGVDTISFDVSNTGTTNLFLRIGVISGLDGYVTDSIQVAPGSGWQSLNFSVRPGDLTQINGANDASSALSSVTRLEVLSALNVPTFGGNARGDLIEAIALFDNFNASSVSAVPEPSFVALLLAGGFIASCNRRRRI
ncbi:MAG: PEP-CTERM sorting domain-containing protein [Planctomycetales bacterium]|nr:PEP-CTERM sorting domain-containing protein [Planctomycetales bacterium]